MHLRPIQLQEQGRGRPRPRFAGHKGRNTRTKPSALLLSTFIVAGLTVWAASAFAAAEGATKHPYSVISARNVFRLTSPPPPLPPPEPPAKDPPLIRITGFVRFDDDLKVLFATVPKEARDIRYFTLKEGERDGILQLVRVHPDQDKVDIINSGIRQTLSLKTDGTHRARSGLNAGNPHVN